MIDAHVHLDDRAFSDASDAVTDVRRRLAEAGIDQGWLIHLITQPWSVQDVAAASASADELITFVHVDPGSDTAAQDLEIAVRDLGYTGLKIHPRLCPRRVNDGASIAIGRRAAELRVPIIVDVFPDGNWLLDGHRVHDVAEFARAVAPAPVLAAHFGGHHVIDLMMMAKRVPNLWVDVSFSLLYYSNSTVPKDILYALRSMDYRRTIYGSDHPDRPIGEVLERSLLMVLGNGADQEQLDRLMHGNAVAFLDAATAQS